MRNKFSAFVIATAALCGALAIAGGTIPLGVGTPAASNGVGSNGQVLSTNADGTTTWVTPSAGTPAGSTTQVQFNSSSAFAGDSGLTYTSASSRLDVAGAGFNSPARGNVRISAADGNGALVVDREGASGAPAQLFRRARGTSGSPTAAQATDGIGSIFFIAHDGTSTYPASMASIRAVALSNQTSGDHGSGIFFDATQAGSATKKQVANFGVSSTGKSRLCWWNAATTNSSCIAWDPTADFQVLMPSTQGGADTFLKNDGSGVLSWATPSSAPSKFTFTNSLTQNIMDDPGPAIVVNSLLGTQVLYGSTQVDDDSTNSASVWLQTGQINGGSATHSSGFMNIGTGISGTLGGNSGAIGVTTGGSNAGNSGNFTVDTGVTVADAVSSGEIRFTTGFAPGAGSTRGGIKLQNGTEGTVGNVWKEININGDGAWSDAGQFDDSNLKMSQTTSPTILVNANAGTGGSATLASGSTDTAGRIILTVVVDAMTPDNAPGTQATVTFHTPFASAPSVVFSANGAVPDTTTNVNPYQENSTTTFSIGFNGSSFLAGTYVYTFDYHVIGFN